MSYSIAVGTNAQALGSYSVAIGDGAIADDRQITIIGTFSIPRSEYMDCTLTYLEGVHGKHAIDQVRRALGQ